MTLHRTLCDTMNVSTALFTHYLIEFMIAEGDNTVSPSLPNSRGISKGKTFVHDRQFRVPQVLNHFSWVNSRGSSPTYTISKTSKLRSRLTETARPDGTISDQGSSWLA